ncbi:MAG: hypothetical protein KC492_05990, partial [Myxococcales bacterium]|nr:hypothetical protein [Myxococcales bacterium]
VTVTGVGGVGKTRLVNELHSHLDGQFAGGIWFVPVAHVREPEQVLAAVATRVGIRDLDADETIRRVVERFDGQPSLLMLDNLEQVIECGTIIARLLHAAPALTILATSRQPLHLLGEVEFPVRPLPVKASADSEPPAETLFIARARESSYRFVVTDDNRKAIASITQRLGGLPLAIELAASWVKVLPPQRLLENLDRQLDVLVRGRRDLPERQQTMRSAIAWSYALLSESERALFRQLSVFAGPFTLGDVERVATVPLTPNRSEFPELLLLETLSSLVTKSLVQALDDPIDPAEPEYSMLEIIRSFGAEQLASHGDELVLRKRHLDHFTAMSARWSEALSTPKRDVRLAQFDREYPNLHAALDWAVLSGNRTAGLRLVAALWVYWDWRGFHAEGARWSDAVLALGGESDPALLAKALYAGSAIAFMQANYARSMELAEACLAAAEASGDEQAIARGLVALGDSTY